ncbi:dehydrogenase/reductase SDR family member 7C-A [Maritalea myrionectae]|uniref:Dehydrogenase/reductase SDR family member 7C-A n=1 Tax=Maritalea myrionectae TaxID=454601 RepID=A0A2R4MCP9_9HYPH|nr:SDR family NAD(P)-dependent oxidoreductase [Maritalea myrionectae]AVX03705.1 dehydrogenase/reductase SDR family member 7C-A [Maritalea myrionectae]
MSFKGKHIWITGASTGIGRALAKKLDADGALVSVSARSEDKLNSLVSEGQNIRAFPVDVTDVSMMNAAIDMIADRAPIDFVVLGAGAWTIMDSDQMDMAPIRTGMEVNYFGTLNAVDKLIPMMKTRGVGHIAIIASVAGYRGLPRSIAYSPTKAALINLAEILKVELEPHNIGVSIVNPGFVDTPLTQDNPFPMPGLMSADEAAEALYKGLAKRKFEISFPFGFTLVMKMLRVAPNWLYLFVMRRIRASI